MADRVYISGPISGIDPETAKASFESAEQLLLGLGMEFVNPLTLCESMPESTWEDFMLRDIAELFKCTHILMLPGWNASRGARVEYHLAIERAMTVWFVQAPVRNISGKFNWLMHWVHCERRIQELEDQLANASFVDDADFARVGDCDTEVDDEIEFTEKEAVVA